VWRECHPRQGGAGTFSTGSGWFPFYTNAKKPENNGINKVPNTGKKITVDCSLKKPKNGLDMGSTSPSRATIRDFQKNLFGKSPTEVTHILGRSADSVLMVGITTRIGIWRKKTYDPARKQYRDLGVQFDYSLSGKAVATSVFLDPIVDGN